MKDNPIDHGYGSGGAFQWFFQRISGAFLLIALMVHFWVLHFVPAGEHGEITYDIVMQRLSSPYWKAMDLIFLTFALYHATNGLTMLVHDYVHIPRLRIVIVGVMWTTVISLFILGSITILSL